MKIHKRLTGPVLLVALSACHGRKTEQAAVTASIDYASTLARLTEAQRNGVFMRALDDARLACQHVDGSARAGTYRQMPVWTATCANGTRWALVVGPNGVAQILSAQEAERNGLVRSGPPDPSRKT